SASRTPRPVASPSSVKTFGGGPGVSPGPGGYGGSSPRESTCVGEAPAQQSRSQPSRRCDSPGAAQLRRAKRAVSNPGGGPGVSPGPGGPGVVPRVSTCVGDAPVRQSQSQLTVAVTHQAPDCRGE